jgi:hypothetical protein
MSEKVLRAVASGVWKVGDVDVECHVVEDGTPILTQRALVRALPSGRQAGDLTSYVKGLPNESQLLSADGTVEFMTHDGKRAKGRTARWLIGFCDGYIDALIDGSLNYQRHHIAIFARQLQKAFAERGLEAVIYEVTGYKPAVDHFSRSMAEFILITAAPWRMRFSPSLTEALCVLYRQPYAGGRQPRFLASIYEKLYRIVLGNELYEAVKKVNPNPRFRDNHHQHLVEQAQRLLERGLLIVEALLRQCITVAEFWQRVAREFRGSMLQREFGF